MDGIQLTFYEITPAPTPTPKVKINPPARLNGRGVNKIPTGPRPLLIRELPTSEQPVSRLEHYGPAALSAIELLTIIVGFDSIEEANALLISSDNLAGLARRPFDDLVTVRGIGPARAARIKAACELGRRLLVAAPAEKPTIKAPADAANLLMLEMGTLEQEHMVILILDTKNHVLKQHTAYVGSLNTAVVRVGELFREAIRLNAAAILVAHNHPSNDPSPSAEDVYVTRQIVDAGKLVNIDVLDHLIICQSRWVSLKERGLGF
jgi:DNA repair protein RadC